MKKGYHQTFRCIWQANKISVHTLCPPSTTSIYWIISCHEKHFLQQGIKLFFKKFKYEVIFLKGIFWTVAYLPITIIS